MFGSKSPNLMRMKLKHSRKCFLTRTGFWTENMPVSLTSFYLSLHWRLRPALAFVWNLASYITAQMRSSIFHWQIPCLCLRYVVVQFSLDMSVNLQSSGAWGGCEIWHYTDKVRLWQGTKALYELAFPAKMWNYRPDRWNDFTIPASGVNQIFPSRAVVHCHC